MERINYSSGAPWEEIVGYSRAVKVGNMVWVTGTVAIDAAGQTVGKGDVAQQTRFVLEKIAGVLAQAGASLKGVVRTRLFVTDIQQWEVIGRVHGEFFSAIKPATTMVEVKALIHPDYLIEIEAEALIL